VTFFTEGDAAEREFPPVGPLEHVVVRNGSLIADRKDGQRADSFDSGGGWIEAEYEFQRALGRESGGPRRPDLRIVAPQGVYLRFVSFGAAREHDPVPELGPYAVVVIGRRAVDADGDRLASRIGIRRDLWELTAVGGSALVGVVRPDIAFRTRSTRYHPEIEPSRPAHPVAVPAHTAKKHPLAASATKTSLTSRTVKPHAPAAHAPSAPPPRAPTAPAPPRQATPPPPPANPRPNAAPAPASRLTDAHAKTLHDRMLAERSTRTANTVATTSGGQGREWAGALWRLRFVIIAALVVLLAVFSVPSVRSLLAGGSPGGSISTVRTGTSVTSPTWTYSVGAVRRVARIGSSQARGTFLVVQVAATNRGGAVARLLPSDFSLVTATGEEYAALAATSGVYSGSENPTSSYAWPTDFPVGRSVLVPLIFDVNASVTGTQLVILDVPSTRIRLE
jgi:hypothetical protein